MRHRTQHLTLGTDAGDQARTYSLAYLRVPQPRQFSLYEGQTDDCACIVTIVYFTEDSLGGGGNGSPDFFWCHQATTKGSVPPVTTMAEMARPHFSFLCALQHSPG